MNQKLIEQIKKAEQERWKLCAGCIYYLKHGGGNSPCLVCPIETRKQMGYKEGLKMKLGEIQKTITWKMSPETESRFGSHLEKLLAIANTVQKLHALDDFEEPWECPACTPDNPAMFNAVRKELYQALIEWEELNGT